MIYLDSCALVKLIITEKETPALEKYLSGRRDEMVSCELALTEVIRVVRRSCFDSQCRAVVDAPTQTQRLKTAVDLLDRIDLIVVDTDSFLYAAVYEDDPFVGSLDALHLVSARAVGRELDAFVTYDKKLGQAAMNCGIPLTQPV